MEAETRLNSMFDYGYDYGNYAGAYEFDPASAREAFIRAWLDDEPGEEYLPLGVAEPTAEELRVYRLACLLGLFASFEDREIPFAWTDEVCKAREEARKAPWAAGVAID